MASIFQQARDLLTRYKPSISSNIASAQDIVRQTLNRGRVSPGQVTNIQQPQLNKAAINSVSGGAVGGFGKTSATSAFKNLVVPQVQNFSNKYIRSTEGEYFPNRVSKLPVREQNIAFKQFADDFAFGGLSAPVAKASGVVGTATKAVKNLTGSPQITAKSNTLPYSEVGVPSQAQNSQKYLEELVQKQKSAKGGGVSGVGNKVKTFLSDIKAKLVDEASPIEDILTSAEKKGNFKVLPKQDIRLQIDRVLRSKNLASQFAKDNGMVDVIKNAPDIDALDQYMIAKQARNVESKGIKTGRDLARDETLINDLSGVYEPLAQQVNQYSRKLLDYSVNSGLIDRGLANKLVQEYPEYVPLQRIFNELEQPTVRGTGRGVASIASQSVIQRLRGSEREIASPIESLLLKTQDAFSQGERNIAAKQLASYKDLPGFEGLLKEVPSGSKAPHTISFIDNGVKKTFATTKEIEAAAKSLNVEQMGLLGKILSGPTRLLQLGATGLNIPFVVTNMLKDELVGFVNSSKAAKTSLLNPGNYVKSLFSALKHDELYDEVVRSAAGGTSFDIARESPNLAVEAIRAQKNLASRIKYTVKNPGELLRVVEDVIGRGEEMGRIKNYRGTKEGLLAEGRTVEDATLLGAQAARNNTANFARRGSWGRVLNWVIPFFNAGVQGSRQLVTSFSTRPSQTAAKVAMTVFTPVAAVTAWNLSDPERKSVYQDIPEYEKDSNIIIVPPNPTQDEKGRWNVIKIPLPPGLSNLGTLVRRPMEAADGLDPVRFGEIATNLISAGTSIDLSSANKIASTFTPQIAKPFVESVTNTNLFTGQKIVPEYLKGRAPADQVKATTPKIARAIGGALNISPLKIENFAQSQLGGLGSQLLGKESALGNLERRFSKAASGNNVDKIYDSAEKYRALDGQIKTLVKEGRTDQAKALIEKNRETLVKGQVTVKFQSKLQEYYTDRNKVLNSSLPEAQKTQILKAIQQQITKLGKAYNNFESEGKEKTSSAKKENPLAKLNIVKEVSASENKDRLVGIRANGNTIIRTYVDEDGNPRDHYQDIDQETGFVGKTVGKTIDQAGRALGVGEKNISEKFGYEDKEKRIQLALKEGQDLIERYKRSDKKTGFGFDAPMQQPYSGKNNTQPTSTPTIEKSGYDGLIRKFFGDQADNAFLTLKNENGKLDPNARNTYNKDGSVDLGIFQINNYTYEDLKRRLPKAVKALGVNSYEDLADPVKNIAFAKLLFDDRESWDESGWNAWYGAPDRLIGPKEKERRIKKGIGVRD